MTSAKKFERTVIKFETQMDRANNLITGFLNAMQDSASIMNACVNEIDEYLTEVERKKKAGD